jgi:hypothetical protein
MTTYPYTPNDNIINLGVEEICHQQGVSQETFSNWRML